MGRLRLSWNKHWVTQAQQFLVLISRPRTPDLAPELTTSFTAFFGPSSTTFRPGFRSPRENASCNCRTRSAVSNRGVRPSPAPSPPARLTPTYLSVCDKRIIRIRVRTWKRRSVHLAARSPTPTGESGVGRDPRRRKRAPFPSVACLLPPTFTPRLHVDPKHCNANYSLLLRNFLTVTSASVRTSTLPVYRCYRNRSSIWKCPGCLGSVSATVGVLPLETRVSWWLGEEKWEVGAGTYFVVVRRSRSREGAKERVEERRRWKSLKVLSAAK